MPSLAEIAQVKIDPDKLKSPQLSRSQKLRLRRKAVKSYIANHYGDVITLDEFASVAHYSGGPSAANLINNMIESGEIIRERVSFKQFSYRLKEGGGEITTVKTRVVEQEPPVDNAVETVERWAKDFAWNHDSNDLRAFIAHLKQTGGGFAADRQLASTAGRKGGIKSRRGKRKIPIKVVEGVK